MGEYPICIIASEGSGMTAAEQIQALRAQRRLLDDLLEDVGRTRRRLDSEPGAGAAWQSAAQRHYMLRRLDLRSQFGTVVWLLEEARGSLSASIAEVARG
ncbi:hypothetical protein E3T55_14655 [Cryobacterium frigoriphilum]|uniref:Uncharacterized protein n=1 Tax=Cryobacterium frigoriphilum TaxID=1259150 RepID=A0A4R8ZW47_9MICO|nr:hypothetical protein [Cryobacterium frigoriphilum]TFD47793.1 hypothetical protein E3T55_14655 [Cryobacterium frigoriphilum]